MATDRLPIDLKLWALVSGLLFAALVGIDVMDGFGRDGMSMGTSLRLWAGKQLKTWTLIEDLTIRSLLFAVPAAIVGWALHGLAVICGIRLGDTTGRQNHLDFSNADEIGVGSTEPWGEQLARLAALKQEGELLSRGRRERFAGPPDPGTGPDAAGRPSDPGGSAKATPPGPSAGAETAS
jgi:hypothetical protein